jgi:O-antigen/teichoic acid export membrane protein
VPSGSVIQRAVRSGVWEGGTNTLNRIIQLAKVAILAQLLPPKEFGILGIGFLVLAVFESFSQLGIDEALIQRQDENVDEYLDTTWVLQILRGLLLSATVFLLAPYAASLFGEPRATNVIRVLGIGPLLLGLKNPGVVYFRKGLQFHRRFIQILSGTVMNFVVAVSLGVLIGNVWALVAGTVTGNVVSVIVSYLLHGYRPRPRINLDRARELVDYGKWIFGGAITNFLQKQGDDVFVGWFLGATPLAFYQMAYRFSNAPSTELTSVIGTVTFPSLSQVQDDYRKLRNGYFRTLRFSVFLALPAAAGIALVAPAFVRVLLGEEWLPTVPVMQLLAVLGAIRVINSGNGPVHNALSRPDLGLKLGAVQVALIAIGIYPAANEFGLVGVGAVIVGAMSLVAPVSTYITLRMIDGSAVRYLRTLLHPVVGSGIMSAALLFLQREVAFGSAAVELVVLITVGAVSYALYSGVAMKLFGYRIRTDLSVIMRSFRGS